MKKNHLFLSSLVALSALSQTAGAVVLFSDTFDRSDTTNIDDAGSQNSTQGGLLATNIELRSSKQTLDIISGQLGLPSNSRARFHDEANAGSRYDFSSALAAFGSSGLMTVTWDWNASAADPGDWTSFSFGTDDDTSLEPDVRVNHSTTDLGVLVKLNGDVEYFDNGVATTLTAAHSATGSIPISISVAYASLDNGGTLTLQSVMVGGAETLSSPVSTFAWDFDDGSQVHLEFEGRGGNPNLVDNLTISVVPEPSMILLGSFGLLAIFRRSRH
ncbi:PEP-CTERM sorting domain-containing protein [Haloferula sargassicola]|uniref:PEP-CTERM protein-sorting domain-containing protein n=1 Tax=Haloferula sargassicola TaxID=490096 RepID=A0ABP9UYX9_9BACT